MRRLVPILVLGVLAAGWVGAQEPPAQAPAKEQQPEAIEILKKVDAATKAVDSVRYKATSVPSGPAAAGAASSEGTVVMEGWTGRGPQRFRVDARMKRPDDPAPVEMSAGGNGDEYFLIDRSTKKAYVDMDPNVLGRSGQRLMGLMMLEFVHDKPFDDELNANVVKLLGKEVVEGEECYKIEIGYGGGQGTTTWFFSTKDYLPRRRIQPFRNREGAEGTVERTISALEVAPKLDASIFKLQLPEGFQKIDDFAP
jgi:outer membrane lipoprotein-sorting protein